MPHNAAIGEAGEQPAPWVKAQRRGHGCHAASVLPNLNPGCPGLPAVVRYMRRIFQQGQELGPCRKGWGEQYGIDRAAIASDRLRVPALPTIFRREEAVISSAGEDDPIVRERWRERQAEHRRIVDWEGGFAPEVA